MIAPKVLGDDGHENFYPWTWLLRHIGRGFVEAPGDGVATQGLTLYEFRNPSEDISLTVSRDGNSSTLQSKIHHLLLIMRRS